VIQESLLEKNPKRLVIIPARGGSKRIPGKNLAEVCGRPIISYVIETAISSELFEEILVSSDDDEILNYAKGFGNITTSKRPKELAVDHSTIFSVLKHEHNLKKKLGKIFDEVWLLSATACLLDRDDLLGLSTQFLSSKTAKAMLAITEYEVPVQWAMSIDEAGKLRSLDFDSFSNRSQDLKKFYHDAGCLAVFSPSVFESFEQGVPEGEFEPYILDRSRAVDLDYPEDLEIVRALMSQKNKLL
jgi:pseudaminic acid cytidylyltransferase